MRETCHRCGEELPAGSGESPFCPHCGTPQLTLSIENQSVETGGEPPPAPDGTPSTGTLPPPLPQQVDWQMAIRCAAAVAGIGAVLKLASLQLDVLSPVSFVWMMFASLITLGFYHKQRPAAWIDARVGTRIGMLVGLCLVVGTAMAMAGWGLVSRFGLHSMGGFDTALTAQITEGLTRSQQLLNSPVDPRVIAFEQTPEFHAGFMLASGAIGAGMILVVSAVGGAFAGMLRMRRGRVA
jgi:hypothetical protein